MIRKILFRCLYALLLIGATATARAESFSFGLFGDIPYSEEERAQLPRLIQQMNDENLSFVVHDGDIKNGHSLCTDETYLDILAVFDASRHPLIYVPGDNEWTDCHRKNNGGYDPVERLKRLRELFFRDDQSLGQRKLPLTTQRHGKQFSGYPENTRWELGGVLFVGLNVPGSNNAIVNPRKPSAEYLQRSRANQAWLAQAFKRARDAKLAGIMLVIQADPELRAANAGHAPPGYGELIGQLRDETMNFAGQVVLVHGDTHHFRIDQPLLDPRTRAPLKNFTRVETFGSPLIGWVKATADASSPQVFHFEAMPFKP